MKRKRFTEEQIIAVLREHEAGAKGGPGAQARDLRGDAVQLEGQVRRPGRVGRDAAEGAGGGEREAEEAARRADAGCGRAT
jgi:hypothetical protein